jgi:hypothetical protein
MIPLLNHQQVKNMTNEELRTLINELANELAYRAGGNNKANFTNPREEIIKKAIKDIEDLKELGANYYLVEDLNCPIPWTCTVEFIENREKRTVVALMRGIRSKKIYAKGIAKCCEDDCFNIHIGRAIALRKALGLEIPEEYLNAPQPIDVQVGDIVEGYGIFSVPYKETVINVIGNKCYYGDGYWDYINSVKVIDDSDRHYEE